jgi:hypothetical protein
MDPRSAYEIEAVPRRGVDIENDYVSINEIGKVYSTEGIFNIQEGTLSVWLYLIKDHPRRDHSIFHTNDSRYVMYLDTAYKSKYQRDVVRIKARAGGNARAVDSGYARGNFPEVSIVIDNNGSLKDFCVGYTWCTPKPYLEGEWHLVTMTWEGFPSGMVRIYMDGELVGEKPYDERYNDDQPLPQSFAVGYRPGNWQGEIIQRNNGTSEEHVPGTTMSLVDGGMKIFDLRLYRRSLTQDDILRLFSDSKLQLPTPVDYLPLVDFKVKTIHEVVDGENLCKLSDLYYKTQVNWTTIYRANLGVIGEDPNLIMPGMELRIPVLR